ncbi:Signal transduction histidine kinase [Faunimonas pinastri]|uniref:histidine kinase n=2 Tax=Faunimonas pinastri TaxID=1855383 RepID=A0A1H9NC22_9HYPH|nr:Signal transduction histidine kinase [Faunimonas pinastri]
MAMPDLPPPLVGWGILLGWMALIVAGATAIALYLTRRLTAPLALLQNTVVAMAPNGNLPELPESGPPEVRATAHAINSLSARLRSAVESRMRLVAAAGHDLRTPMTRMRLRAEFLPEEDRALWLKDLGELERIADSAIRLVREEARQEAAEIVALDLLLRDLVDDLAALGLNAELREAEPMSVHGGELGLTRALRNLAINAATHGRRAEISLARIDGWAEIRIEDQGPGIPEELLERVFEPFFRVDPARRQTVPGAGLGLAIAHEIITRNDGTLKLSNKPEGGLLQVVRLRLLAASEDRAPLREPQ